MAESRQPELLSQAAARQLLERAGQIDYESTSVDSLRAAAVEAGISPAAFEAALAEMRGRDAVQPPARSRWTVRKVLAIVAAVGLLGAATMMMVIPNAIVEEASGVHSSEILVRCLPMETAETIARTTLGPDGLVSVNRESRVVRFQGSPADLQRLTAALRSAERTSTSCTTAPPGR